MPLFFVLVLGGGGSLGTAFFQTERLNFKIIYDIHRQYQRQQLQPNNDSNNSHKHLILVSRGGVSFHVPRDFFSP